MDEREREREGFFLQGRPAGPGRRRLRGNQPSDTGRPAARRGGRGTRAINVSGVSRCRDRGETGGPRHVPPRFIRTGFPGPWPAPHTRGARGRASLRANEEDQNFMWQCPFSE
eukprot:scaffold4800_cov327-Prasinococcus_capsulatus_cf.AAC.6